MVEIMKYGCRTRLDATGSPMALGFLEAPSPYYVKTQDEQMMVYQLSHFSMCT